MFNRTVLSAIVLTAALPATAPAADLFVSPDGPYTTIQAAIDAAVDGDTVTIADGTWTSDTGYIGIHKPITLRAASGPEQCVIRNTQIHVTNIAEGEVRLEGLTMRQTGQCIYAQKANRLSLHNCVMEDTLGAMYSSQSTCQLTRCRVQRVGSYADSCTGVVDTGQTTGLRLDFSPEPVLLDSCVIADVKGDGVYVKAPDAILRNCVIYACLERGVAAPNHCRLINCTIINNRYGLATKNDSAIIENCIFAGNTTDIVPFDWASPLDRPESISVRNSYIPQGWPGENVYQGDPQITWHGWLQAGSPCIDAGIVTDYGANDVDGELRMHNGIVDIGADEFCDQDSDGLPDYWETFYFGSPTAATCGNDEDGDTLTNSDEYLQSSNPLSTYWYVDAARPDDSGDGRTWRTAKKTIRAAACRAVAGEIILVADGHYTDSYFFAGPMWIKSVNGPEHCMLSVARLALDSAVSTDFVLDGFSIIGTNSQNPVIGTGSQGTPVIQNCIISGGKYGIYIEGAGAVVRNCRITGNSADGIYMPGDYLYPRMLRLENCEIDHNGREGVSACNARNIFPLITLRDSSFHHNGQSGFWGWAYLDVARCRFEGNKMCGFGITAPDLLIRDCVAVGNGWFGLGISSTKERLARRLLVENCTVAHNYYRGGIGGFAQGPDPHQTIIRNCIIWDNMDSPSGQIELQPRVSYVVTNSDIQGGWEGIGNMNQEPFFAAPGCLPGGLSTDSWTGGDYRLLSFSPCIDAGDPNYVAAADETDADGRPRILHSRLDMGAYENASADFHPDAQIDAADLAAFAARWLDESCEEPDWCAGADLTVDGRVDTRDFARLTAEWSLGIDAPALWYKLDETAGAVAYDSSIFNRIGYLRNVAANCWVNGRTGNALSLDGVDDYLYVDFYSPPAGARSRTVAAWIKTTDTSGVIIAWGPAGVPGARWTLVTEPAGRLRLEVGNGAAVGTTNICDNQWHHVAAVLDNDGTPNVNEVVLYVDGMAEAPSIPADRAIDTVAGKVTIGVSDPSASAPPFFRGLLDDIRIYDRALSPEEIAQLAR